MSDLHTPSSAESSPRATARPATWFIAAVSALLALVWVADTIAAGPKYGGQDDDGLTKEEILERVPEEPDILINVRGYDLPSTHDLVTLGNRATPALVNCLVNNLDDYARSICANVLVSTRDARAIEPLIAALDDPDSTVQGYAIEALSQIEARNATDKLIEIMKSDFISGYKRRDAIRALGRSGDPKAIEPLFEHFRAEWDVSTQEALWDMRRQLSDEQRKALILDPLRDWDDVNSSVLSFSVERAGDLELSEARSYLTDYYKEAGYNTRNRIIYNLGRIGDKDAVPFVEEQIDHTGEARLLNNVTFALERLGVDVVPILEKTVTDERAYIRYNAAFVAGDLELEALVPLLSTAVKEDINDIMRSESAVALGRIGSKDAIPALEAAAKEENKIVRRDAIWALLQIDYDAYRERALQEVRDTETSSVRDKLINALADRAEPAIVSEIMLMLDPLNYSDRNIGIRFLDHFETMSNAEALAWLLRIAGTGNHDAYRLLARFADKRTEFLIENWFAQPRGEAEQIMRALARLGSKERKEMARKYFEEEGSSEQLYAAFYYAALGDPDGMDVLLTALEVAPVYLKRIVAIILTELDYTKMDGAQARLEALLEHPDVYVRLYAARPLAHRGFESGKKHLWSELEKKIPFIRDETLSIVRRLPSDILTPLLEGWIKKADPMLAMSLEPILERSRERQTDAAGER